MSVCLFVCMSVCMYVCMYVWMYPCTPPLLPSISRKKHGFSSVFAKMMSKNTEFFQIFGKRMQEAQASKKAGRGNRAWDPWFATPGPRRLRLVERHQIAARSWGGAPPHVSDVGWGGGVIGGGYPLSSLRCPTRRAMSADIICVQRVQQQPRYSGFTEFDPQKSCAFCAEGSTATQILTQGHQSRKMGGGLFSCFPFKLPLG